LLEQLHRQERIPYLMNSLKQLRPMEDWDSLLPAEPEAVSPYKGLLYFDEADAPLFFGREQVTAELLDHLRQHRFLAVVGASGSGKSSVVRAGVITPSGAARSPMTGEQRRLAHPPHHPRRRTAEGAGRQPHPRQRIGDGDEDAAGRFAGRTPTAWICFVPADGRGRRPLLLIVDQFEELFTQCRDAAARELFVESGNGRGGRPTGAAQPHPHPARRFLRPGGAVGKPVTAVAGNPPENRWGDEADELRQAIEGPAAKGNWTLQPGLVETMLQDVGREPGALPLLSHALQETWARRAGRTLTLAGYQAAGGVRRAIAQTADAVYASLTPEQQTMARNIFLRLTELGEGTEDTRRRVALAELLPEGEGETAVFDLLDLLARKAAGDAEQRDRPTHAEVAHEALIREWPALRGWLDENREGLRLHRQLTEAAGPGRRTGRMRAICTGAAVWRRRGSGRRRPGGVKCAGAAFFDRQPDSRRTGSGRTRSAAEAGIGAGAVWLRRKHNDSSGIDWRIYFSYFGGSGSHIWLCAKWHCDR
jgi:hypothetical protein